MHRIVCLLTILLGGCQGLSLLERPTADTAHIMPLWASYQQCLATDDPADFHSIIEQFERTMHAGVEPPTWMRTWGPHVQRQPLRTAVDPHALGAACTLHAAGVMAAKNQPDEARALYQRVLARYSHREWTYYVDQARERLAGLQDSSPLVAASSAALFR